MENSFKYLQFATGVRCYDREDINLDRPVLPSVERTDQRHPQKLPSRGKRVIAVRDAFQEVGELLPVSHVAAYVYGPQSSVLQVRIDGSARQAAGR